MRATPKSLIITFWLATAALFAAAVVRVFAFTPVEQTMGPVQKIFYLHLPIAINTFLACMVNFIASLLYLWQRRRRWDHLASASATVAVLLCSIVLLTGMIWGKSAWGRWWTWSPRLTFSLLLWLLYATYLTIRPSIESPTRRALVAAVYGIVAFLDVPLVWLSVRLMPDIHPTSVTLEPSMRLTLWLFFVPVTMLTAGLIAARFTLSGREADERGMAEEQEEDDPAFGPDDQGLTLHAEGAP
jgi:heme exporter protein C